MMQPLTLVQSLYWQKEALQDIRWSLDRKIMGIMKRNKKPHKLLAERMEIMKQIRSINTQMKTYEIDEIVA